MKTNEITFECVECGNRITVDLKTIDHTHPDIIEYDGKILSVCKECIEEIKKYS